MFREQSLACWSIVLTMTVFAPGFTARAQDHLSSAVTFEELPRGIASFGAATFRDHVYVYSGHTGRTHVYSYETTSTGFFRASLTHGGAWESLPMERPAQGVALVAGSRELFRIGGMHAINEPGQAHDLHSLSDVSAFDPNSRTWRRVPDLPEPRSSHRAAVLDDRLFVFGGWSLNGGEDGVWLDHGLTLDLRNESGGWKSITQPAPIRALEVIEHKGRIWLIGGLTTESLVSQKTYVFDVRTESWSNGPDVPGMPANGNGIAAAIVENSLVIAGMDGKIYRLAEDQNSWGETGRLPSSRIHHRLTGSADGLLVIAGAARSGHLKSVEFVSLER